MIYSRFNGEMVEICVEYVKWFIVKNYLKLKIYGKNEIDKFLLYFSMYS